MTRLYSIDLQLVSRALYKQDDGRRYKARPGRVYRLRQLIGSEPRPDAACTHVIIKQVGEGLRIKHFLVDTTGGQFLASLSDEDETLSGLWRFSDQCDGTVPMTVRGSGLSSIH